MRYDSVSQKYGNELYVLVSTRQSFAKDRASSWAKDISNAHRIVGKEEAHSLAQRINSGRPKSQQVTVELAINHMYSHWGFEPTKEGGIALVKKYFPPSIDTIKVVPADNFKYSSKSVFECPFESPAIAWRCLRAYATDNFKFYNDKAEEFKIYLMEAAVALGDVEPAGKNVTKIGKKK